MTINYDSILKQLNNKFTLISKKEKKYFINNEGAVVASYDDNSISMFFKFPKCSEEIWNHKGIVVATFAKNFQVNDIIADIIIVDGLCGACNDTKIIGNYAYIDFVNDELRDLFEENSKQKLFDQLPYEKRIEILEKLTGATFKGARIDGIRLFKSDKEPKIDSCGEIFSSNGIASIKLSDEMTINNIKVNKKSYDMGFDLNILNINGIQPDFDYSEVYNFWRQKLVSYYNDGPENIGSLEMVNWVERRRKSTADKDSVFYIGNPYSHILNPIYYDSKSSLNSRKLQMKFVLSQILSDPEIKKIMKNYDFNIRKVDIKLKSKKR